MSNRSIIALIALAVAIFLVTQTFYTVDPTKQVLVRQFGAIVGDPKTEPGLYAKVPLVQDIQRIDRRLLDYEAEEFEIIAGDQKRLVVELDGGQHTAEGDAERTARLEELGYRVIRFWNNDALGNTDAVLAVILREARSLPSRFKGPSSNSD